MDRINSLRTGRHSIFGLHAHLVFVTQYRGRVFSSAHLETLFRKVCQDFEAALREFNGETEHVHLLVTYLPWALSKRVNSLKGASSRRMKQFHPDLIATTYRSNALWNPSYFAGSVGGAPLSVVKQYIEQQAKPAIVGRLRLPRYQSRTKSMGLSAHFGKTTRARALSD